MTFSPTAKPDMAASTLDSARAVIAQEAAGLEALADSLGGDFVRAVDVLAGLQGRVVGRGHEVPR